MPADNPAPLDLDAIRAAHDGFCECRPEEVVGRLCPVDRLADEVARLRAERDRYLCLLREVEIWSLPAYTRAEIRRVVAEHPECPADVVADAAPPQTWHAADPCVDCGHLRSSHDWPRATCVGDDCTCTRKREDGNAGPVVPRHEFDGPREAP